MRGSRRGHVVIEMRWGSGVHEKGGLYHVYYVIWWCCCFFFIYFFVWKWKMWKQEMMGVWKEAAFWMCSGTVGSCFPMPWKLELKKKKKKVGLFFLWWDFLALYIQYRPTNKWKCENRNYDQILNPLILAFIYSWKFKFL